MDERKRDCIVAYLRRRMDEFEITLEAVAAALAEDDRMIRGARYQNATGQTWDGTGEMPQWLKQAASAGQAVDHFAVATHLASASQTKTNWQRDPFAGSPIAGRPASSVVWR
ncbi:H-NS histone family protein [Paraburkholderia bryophila]|uniref:H-NS family nucleoid-associated regulatory protein n=1 Tax=Paraburkholderia bryophila TaxID=420952 RepID=UPI00234B9953|nr:H-NS family nucleoid-associated regulatory protein [Paraburkholderia bryophila]WCM23605.1 H-NS histone family protein [Paraburkholderia bryophila]